MYALQFCISINMATIYLEEQESKLIKLIERVQQKINDTQLIFQDFYIIQKQFDKLTNSSSYLHCIHRYSALAQEYLKKLIVNSDKQCKDQKTKISYSYFFQQSLKIVNRTYFPFLNRLIELNFINFMDKLHKNAAHQQFEYLVNSNKLCNFQCIGCNQFYYQFLPIQLNTRKRNYQMIFLNNSHKHKQHPINTQTEVKIYPNHGDKIDLLNLQNDLYLLKQIVNLLNSKGGFILVGCKRMQEFTSIKNQFPYQQLNEKYMHAYFVMGECVNAQIKHRIREGVSLLIRRIQPQIEIGTNMQISFVPVKHSPFKLGFNLEQVKLAQQQFNSKQLSVIMIKVHPNKAQRYKYVGQKEQEEQQYQFPFVQENSYEGQVRDFMNTLNALNEDINQEDQVRQSFMLKNQISYFDQHNKCNSFAKKYK